MNKKVICLFFEQPFHFASNWRRLLILSLVIFSFFLNTGETFAQIALSGSSTAVVNNNNTLVIPRPNNLAEGDLMIASILQSSNNDEFLSDATATGWLLVDGRQINAGTPNDRWYGTVLYKVATTTDESAPNFTFGGDPETEDMVGGIMAFSGVDVTGGYDVSGTLGAGPFDTTPTGLVNLVLDNDFLDTDYSITTESDNAAVVMIGMVTNDRDPFENWDTTSPGALTQIFEALDGGGGVEDLATAAAWAIKPTAGPTGDGTADIDDDADSRSMLLALRPVCASIISQSTPGETISGCSGTTFSPISVTAAGSGLSYQWYQNTTGIASGGTTVGTNSPSYTPSPPSDGTAYYYYVVVTASCGSATSAISGEFISSTGQAQYLTPGLQTFFVPDGVTSITVETWGAGGRGSSILSQNSRGAGGGGGAYSRSTISVTPGEPIAVYVGTGSTTDSPGESSWVARTESVSDALVLAVGGDSGPDDSSGRPLGSGGDATAGIGDFRFSGGDGADRGNGRNGGGGSSAGTSSNGNSPTPPNDVNRVFGAVAPLGGGNGGDGGPETGATSNGLSGAQPGGGGGGARRTSSSGTGIGGSGGNGQVIISYTCPSNTPCSRVIDDGAISGTTIIEFTADCRWDAPENLLEFEVLAIGGGGGGGVRSGGGGGGGGAIHARANIDERFNSGLPAGTSFFIEIGNGGLGSTDRDNKGLNGGESRFDSGGDYEIIAGGGGGGGSDDNAAEDGNDGQASSFATTLGFTIVSGINFNGSGGGGGHDGNGGNGYGDGGNADQHSGAGGGGLSGNDGQNAPDNEDGGNGASGRSFSSFSLNISLNRFFAAGGGGGSKSDAIGVGGSASAGGDGGVEDKNDATAGGNATTPGSGGGGSGHDEDVIGGNGADGIVFVKYSNIRILPVEYLYFNAKYNSFLRSGDLAWATAKEWENDRFEVERSVNNLTSWERIGVIDGAGYSDGPIDYDYQDLKLPLAGGNIFYRLKQVDLDGEFSFSDTKSIKVEALPGTTQWRIFPNPTSGYPFSIELLDPSAYRDEEVTLRVISPIGQYEFIQVNEIQKMGSQVSNYFEGKSSGVYTLEISWGLHREYHKVILTK